MVTSYNGWVASPNPAAIDIDTNWSVLGSRPFSNGGFPGGVKAGAVSVIFTYLVTRLHNEVEPMMTGPAGEIGYGCWGYGYRANVNNPSVLSCHASGTAIDYNAPRHPNGTVAPGGGSGWTTAQAEKIRGIIADLGGVVRWLWSNDPMHFEIIGSSAQCAVVAARIRREPAKPNPPSTNPSTPSNPPAPGDDEWWFDMATPEQRQQFKEMVHEALTWWAEEGPQSGIDPVLLRGAVRGAIINAADGRDPELLQAIKEIVRDGAMWARNDAQDAPDQAGK